jgi:hypothetical protein
MNKYIKNLNNTIKIKEKYIIAADFETLLINNEHYVFAIGLFFKGIYKNIYIKKNLKNDEEIIENSYKILNEFIVYLLSLSDNTIYIYFHNLGKFDGIFILNIIYKIIKKSDKFSVIIRNNIIYKITYNNLIFLDSLLILNENLNNLANKILNDKKLEIDYNRLNNYYSCINNKNEILLYLYKDVNILYNIILILINKFIDLFYIDITKYFTIPSIAMSIYRTNYLNDYKIYIPEDKEYIYFKKSYRGGLTNIIIPKINDGYIYDINSLYPFIMKTKKMPLGKPI